MSDILLASRCQQDAAEAADRRLALHTLTLCVWSNCSNNPGTAACLLEGHSTVTQLVMSMITGRPEHHRRLTRSAALVLYVDS